jgi:hypothetical protein
MQIAAFGGGGQEIDFDSATFAPLSKGPLNKPQTLILPR